MKTGLKSLLLLFFVGVMLIAAVNIAQARWRRGGDNTFYDFRTCKDGIEVDLALAGKPFSAPTLDGKLLLNGSTVLQTTSIPLANDPVSIPGIADPLQWSGSKTASWTKPLKPGSRVELHLLITGVTVVDKIYTTVENCTLADPAPTTESTLFTKLTDSGEVIPAKGMLTSTMPVSLNKPLGDVNVAMYVRAGTSQSAISALQASLVSPKGTTVDLFSDVSDPSEPFLSAYYFGSYSFYSSDGSNTNNSLYGDEKANFVLDDDSVFQFNNSDPAVKHPFINTAVAPDEPLSAFIGENSKGNWKLVIHNNGGENGLLISWNLEIEEAPPCYALTLNQTGSGSKPTASPAKSTACAAGKYIAGESINLTAYPAAGYYVGSWTGTNNDASTAATNAVTMPAAAHTVTVNYVQDAALCYALTLNQTGAGSKPTASPAKSSGCVSGQYVAGELINLTAYPASGHHVGSWTGTNNDASTATTNTVAMPAAAHAASANYVEDDAICYDLTLGYSGPGSQPTALPANSAGCDAGQYIAGETINVTAYPAAGHHVGGWTGTNNDASTASTNVVAMPAAAHAASASYVEDDATCYVLTLSYSGSGSQPTALPANSAGCDAGQYIAGQVISVTAYPAAGYSVGSWSGTNNDASTASTNVVAMPAAAHSVTANYVIEYGEFAYLPVILAETN